MGKPIDYIAKLSHVREVSLLGTADLGYWREHLGRAGLEPAQQGGRARILIIASAASFRGIRFRELSVTALVARSGDGTPADASALIHAYNSNRLLALCERALFSTPYSRADVQVSAGLPASLGVVDHDGSAFRAEMGDGPSPGREPSRCGEDGWEGPVYLPGGSRPGRLFFARIRGETQAYPFRGGVDSLRIEPASGPGIIRTLADSGFVPEEWIVRDDAVHARSKTLEGSGATACSPRA